jgi:iron complex transport system substrate-binding protein
VERLEKLGIPVLVTRARRLDDAPRLAEAIARLTGGDASRAAADYRVRLQRLRAAQAGKPGVRVFVEIWHRPLTTIAGTHWINEALELCGGENVFRELGAVAPVVSWEEVYRREPRLILGATSASGEPAFRANWAGHAALEAVRSGRLAYVEADTIHRPTLRLAEGVAHVCAALDRARP